MITEADWKNWTIDDLKPYVDIALEAFGPERCMFGSDWPVALLAIDYQPWVTIVREFISTLSEDEQSAIEGGVATRVYGL